MDVPYYDPRVAKLPMMSSLIPTIQICLAYVIFVKFLGPAWMRNRKPYELRGVLIVYNFALVIFNAWIFHKFGKHGWYWKYSWTCENVEYLETEDSLEVVKAFWLYLISKFIELADTVFFILRKKDSQITALHIVHHTTVPLSAWYMGSLGASGYNSLFGFLNSFVHIWMYLYYALAAIGPSIQKYLWWKKYLTRLQMVQFCLIVLAMISVMITPGCKVSWRMMAMNLGNALLFLILFAIFYQNSYKAQRKTKFSENGAADSKNIKRS